jgi:DNA helicase-2/ATP-dependent DNA helicase PcrA
VLSDLTPEQRAAVTHAGGPLAVLAGAGAGKTRVLCHRLAWLVDEGAAPDEVLALTFTRQAAHELRGRAEDLLGRSHETLRVTTFHAFAQWLARVHGVERGLLAATEPADRETRMMLLLERLADLDLELHDLRGNRVDLVDGFLRRIDRCKDELVAAADFRRWAEAAAAGAATASQALLRRRDAEFGRVYEAHDRWLAEDGLEDFGESIVRALALLRAHPDRLEAARAEARHVLVDEFQDTNHAQAELLYLLSGEALSLVVVGDDDQGIYRFRGASAKNLADFRRRYPEAAEIRLERNYRSTQAVLDAAGAVVARIPDRAPKRLVARPEAEGPPPEVWTAPDPDGQARAVVAEIVRLAALGVPYEEQAVLMRAVRLEARPVVRELERAGVPHQVRGGVGLFERREVRAAVAWLRAATDPADAQAHLRVAADPALGLPWGAAAQAVAEAAAAGRPVLADLLAVGREAGAPELERRMAAAGRAAVDLPAADVVGAVLDACGLRAAALSAGGAEGAARLAGLNALEGLARGVADRRPELDARGLAALLSGLGELGFRGDAGVPAAPAGVQVMTVHQAKGREFDAVFVIGMVAAAWPGKDRSETDIPNALLPESLPPAREAHLAESRRLAYVAMTRARRHLVLVTLDTGASGAGQRPSPFVGEALEAVPAAVERRVGAAPEQAVLEAVARARAAFEEAAGRAAEAQAAGRDAEAAVEAAATAARDLVTARAAAMRPSEPAPAPRPEPRPARPGLELSPSAVERYRACPLAYRLAFVDRVPVRPTAASAVGIAAHGALEAHYRPGGTGGDGAALVERFAKRLARLRVAATPEGRQALARAREALPRYHERTVRSGARPVAVERPFTLAVGPHWVHGRVDRVDAHPAGGHQLVDYKTGKPGDASRAGDDLVLRLYLAGAREAWGIAPRGATLAFVLDGDVRPVHPEAEEIAMAHDQVREAADGIALGRFEPRPSWACRTCDFALLCPAQDR